MTETSSYDTEEALLESIKGVFVGNDKTRVGGCYHKIIEQEAFVADGGLVAEHDGVRIFFTAEQAAPAVEFKLRHPTMIHEVPVRKIYETSYGPVQVSGRLDGMEGRYIQDAKCKFGNANLLEFSDSYQWRYYQDMLGLSIFHYDIFPFSGFEALPTGSMPYRLDGVTVGDPVRLECVRYGAMADDCRLMLQEFLDYIQLRNLWSFLKTVDVQPTLS